MALDNLLTMLNYQLTYEAMVCTCKVQRLRQLICNQLDCQCTKYTTRTRGTFSRNSPLIFQSNGTNLR